MPDTPLSRRIAALVRDAENSGVPRKKQASRLRISKSALSQWTTGAAKPSYENLVRAAQVYGVSTDYLLTGSEAEARE